MEEGCCQATVEETGLEYIFKNCRLLSNLPAISKLIEKVAIKQIQDHSDENNTTPTHQSAYKVNHSCETALLFLHNEILSSFEKQEITNLCAINLSAVFDTVDHGIMISTSGEHIWTLRKYPILVIILPCATEF